MFLVYDLTAGKSSRSSVSTKQDGSRAFPGFLIARYKNMTPFPWDVMFFTT